MSGDRRYFKLWAAEALLSDDLDDLGHEGRSVWLYLMAAASLEEPRWTIRINPKLARKCKVTPERLAKAINSMVELGMAELHGAVFTFLHAARWNEETERGGRGKKPSDSAEETARRKREERERKRDIDGVSRPVTRVTENHVTPVTPVYKEEEEEKEEEQEQKGVTNAAAARCCRLWEEETGTSMPRATWDRMETWIEKAGEPWVQDAIRETGKNGAKAWKYTGAILERWHREGRDVPKPAASNLNGRPEWGGKLYDPGMSAAILTAKRQP